MSKTVLTVRHNCLDNLLAELDEVCFQQYKRVIFFKENFKGITLNIPEVQPGVVDSLEKLEKIMNYAGELGLPIMITTTDARIYGWAEQLGLTALYELQAVAC